MSKVRQWILDNSPEDIIIQVDDDIKQILYRTDIVMEIKDPDVIDMEFLRIAQLLSDLKLGYATITVTPRPYLYQEEFKFNSMGGGIYWYNIECYKAKNDDKADCKEDVDKILQELMYNRIILMPKYLAMYVKTDTNEGGDNINKNSKVIRECNEYMKLKWGKYYTFDDKKNSNISRRLLRKSYRSVWNVLKTATSVQEASDIFLVKFESPKNTGEAVKKARASYGEQYLKIYQKEETKVSKIENAVTMAEAIALDDTHGYDQVDRWGNPNYDCSGLVINCLENAGIPAKQKGATYTGNMPEVLPNIGFKNVITSVNLSTGSGMKRGDVLLGNGHTAFYCGNGKLVHASINEKGTTTGGKSGDQTGREICIRSYYNKPWKYVYRYTGEVSNAGTVSVRNYLQKGDSGDAVKEMQKMLIGCGYSCGKSGVDGSFGGDTEKALTEFQEFYALEVDGKYGPASKAKLTSVYSSKQSASAPEVAKSPRYTVGKAYTLQVELKVRTGPGTNYAAKKHSQLTADGQKHDKDNDGCLDAGTVITCKEVNVVGNDVWIKAPSGWMAGYYKGQVFIK